MPRSRRRDESVVVAQRSCNRLRAFGSNPMVRLPGRPAEGRQAGCAPREQSVTVMLRARHIQARHWVAGLFSALSEMPPDSALDSVDNHWAIRVVDPEDRATALRYAVSVNNRISAGEASRLPGMPPLVIPLASAYTRAGQEWLDFEGSARPTAVLSERQSAVRAAHIEAAANQAFLLTAALPVETRPEEHHPMLYRALLLAALARVGKRSADFEQWLLLFGRAVFPSAVVSERWDHVLLRRIVELWTHLLRGSGPSGLRPAMEIIASIREERPIREAELLATAPDEEARIKFHLFSLFHLGEAATDLLLFRLHAEPERIMHQLYGRLELARQAAAGDPRLDATCDWLFEAARMVVDARTAQLELLSEQSAG
jgi:hypothetical protein